VLVFLKMLLERKVVAFVLCPGLTPAIPEALSTSTDGSSEPNG